MVGVKISPFFSRDKRILKNKRNFSPGLSNNILITVLNVIKPDWHKLTSILHKVSFLIKLRKLRDIDKKIRVDHFSRLMKKLKSTFQ